MVSKSSAIQIVSRAALGQCSMSRCWLRASAVESAGRVNAAMRGFTMVGIGNSALVFRAAVDGISALPVFQRPAESVSFIEADVALAAALLQAAGLEPA